ncbi:MAG: thiamine phosphate synthase [Chitinophagales bacterium]|nr:thiamine phosphate synthase [Chitinophagales bacterium]
MNKKISGFHFLTQDLPHYSHEKQVQTACEAGVKWIQLRIKNRNEEEWLQIAEHARAITAQFDVKLLINDHPYIAKKIGADGVHLGQDDMPWTEARKILGRDSIIGLSTHTMEQLLDLKNAEIDYVGLGPFRLSGTKQNQYSFLQAEGIKTIISGARKAGMMKPVIAIGGIQLTDVESIFGVNANGVAVSSAVSLSGNPGQSIREFINECGVSEANSGIHTYFNVIQL